MRLNRPPDEAFSVKKSDDVFLKNSTKQILTREWRIDGLTPLINGYFQDPNNVLEEAAFQTYKWPLKPFMGAVYVAPIID